MISKAIYEILKDFAGGNVFALRAPHGQKGRFIIYQRIDKKKWRSINGPSGMAQALIQIDCYAEDYDDATALGDAVELLLDGYKDEVVHTEGTTRIAGISLQNSVDLLDETDEPPLFRINADYRVTYRQ